MHFSRQKGLSLFSVLLVMIVLGAILVLGMKVMPVYSEYAEVRQAITALSAQSNVGELSVRRDFNQRAGVAGIASIKGENLVVVTGGNYVYIRAAYQREVPLFSNVSLLFKFDTQAGQPPQ
ncbi:DUF4845 domain-containing protein [Chromobacterium rhizoryzae]|uniref:DUF4845 domain-containing protein n=1 Tax=Chromobacterium rhizoryzae TaxID=1778675 RepID=UPI001D07086D|nr:DUF4845 domain-containing protein [Chromobacterium rhizoryzae]